MDATPDLPADDDTPRMLELLDVDPALVLCARCSAHPPVLEGRDGEELPVVIFALTAGAWAPTCRACLALDERLALERRQFRGIVGLMLEAEGRGEPSDDLLEDAVCLIRRIGELEREAAAAADGPEAWLGSEL